MCKLAAILVGFVARCCRGFEDVRKLVQFGGDDWKIIANRVKCRTRIVQKSPLVYTCDKSSIGERDRKWHQKSHVQTGQ